MAGKSIFLTVDLIDVSDNSDRDERNDPGAFRRLNAPYLVVTVHTPALPETQELANIKNKLEK